VKHLKRLVVNLERQEKWKETGKNRKGVMTLTMDIGGQDKVIVGANGGIEEAQKMGKNANGKRPIKNSASTSARIKEKTRKTAPR